jgi:hypothetical protein
VRSGQIPYRPYAQPVPAPVSTPELLAQDDHELPIAHHEIHRLHTVAERAADYVTEATWTRLFRARRNHCKELAEISRQIIAAKDQLHAWLGGLVSWLLALLGIGNDVRDFVRELAASIPIPFIDVKAIAVARGVQVSGILLCVMQGDDLTECQCFIDLALTETKTRVKKILAAAGEDWVNLGSFPSGKIAGPSAGLSN